MPVTTRHSSRSSCCAWWRLSCSDPWDAIQPGRHLSLGKRIDERTVAFQSSRHRHQPEQDGRQPIVEYRQLVERVLQRLTPQNLNDAIELARIYEDIKGFGHVKEGNVHQVKAQAVNLLEEIRRLGSSRTQSTGGHPR